MRIIRSIEQMSEVSKRIKLKRKTIGFVPTMGALHEGHLSLIRKAHKENDIVVVSIFVNPTQFGPSEDFRRYPRNLKTDSQLCGKEGVDIVFLPQAKDMYPKDYKTWVNVADLSNILCGKYRSGHFKGVATVVTKLFNIVQSDIVYFGQKDAQQAIIIKKLASDLNMPIKIKVMPTVRERDGLAMSSRNMYLKQAERKDATILYQALNLAKDLIKQGNRNPPVIIKKMRQLINQKKNAKIQYISVVDLKDLEPIDRIKDKALISLAVYVGKTRLIDNIIVKAKRGK